MWDIGLNSTSIPSYNSTLIYSISHKQIVNIQHRHIHYYNPTFMHLSICNTIINQSFNIVFTHITKLLNIHTYTQHITWKPIREKTTRCSSSRICMRKQMHLLSVHKATYSVQYLIFYLYRLLPPLMLFDLLYPYHSTLLLLSDTHTASIDSTFFIYLRTQL